MLCSALRERRKKSVGESGKIFYRMHPNSEKTSANVTNMWAQKALEAKSRSRRLVQGMKRPPYVVAGEKRSFLVTHRTLRLCARMCRKVFLANVSAADMRVDLRG